MQIEHFFSPNSGEDQKKKKYKKKGLHQKENTFFSSILGEDQKQSPQQE